MAGAALAYAALSFGACVTGAVLALTVGSSELRAAWAAESPRGDSFSHYSEMLFVFTWAATAQLAVVVAAALGLWLGGDTPVAPDSPLFTHVALGFAFILVGIYAVFELVTIVGTISQLGVVTDTAARLPLEDPPDVAGKGGH